MQYVTGILIVLALCIPIALPAGAAVATSRLAIWWKASAILLASLASLPIGSVLILVASYPGILTSSHVNAGVGFAALPIVVIWFVSFAVTVAWMSFVAVKLIARLWR